MVYTRRADRVFKQAAEEARLRGDREWSREHVLLALARLGSEAGARVAEILDRLGVDERRVREAFDRHSPPGPELVEPPVEPGKPPVQLVFAGRQCERLFLNTRWIAAYLGERVADSEHVLLGVLAEDRPEGKVQREVGLTFEVVFRELTGKPAPEEIRPHRPVEIAIEDLGKVLGGIRKFHPEIGGLSHNFDDERAWVDTHHDIDLEHDVKRILAEG